LADRLDEATGQLRAELAARRAADAELEALWTMATRVRDMVLDNVDRPSSLAASMSMVVELLEGWIDVEAANGVRWGFSAALVASVSHFLELKSKLELLGSGRNVDLTEDEANAL
jgi:hypothetical protein